MRADENTERYGRIAVIIHWVTAGLIVGLLVSGFRAAGTLDGAEKARLLRLHAPLGILILALTLFRLLWWWRWDRRPEALPDLPRWQSALARAVHVALYAAVLGMAGTGIGTMVLSGAGPIIFLGSPGPFPDLLQYQPRVEHGIGVWALIALLASHIGAALHHQFVRRDGALGRMWFARG